jgi:hypothetical protein
MSSEYSSYIEKMRIWVSTFSPITPKSDEDRCKEYPPALTVPSPSKGDMPTKLYRNLIPNSVGSCRTQSVISWFPSGIKTSEPTLSSDNPLPQTTRSAAIPDSYCSSLYLSQLCITEAPVNAVAYPRRSQPILSCTLAPLSSCAQ